MERLNFDDIKDKNPKESMYMLQRMYIDYLEKYIDYVLKNQQISSFSFVNSDINVVPVNVSELCLTCEGCGCHPNIIYTTPDGSFCVKCVSLNKPEE